MATGWQDLPADLVQHIATFLPDNEAACTLRLVNRAANRQLQGFRAVRLSRPSPPHAFFWRWGSPASMRDLALKQRHKLLALTAGTGSLANLQVALAAAHCSLVQPVLDVAAAGGFLDVCQLLLDLGCPIGEQTVAAAAKADHRELVLSLLDHGVRFQMHRRLGKAAWTAAAAAGNRELCEVLLAKGVPAVKEAATAAARSGHIGLTDWLLTLPRMSDLDHVKVLEAAAVGFNLASFQRLYLAQQNNVYLATYKRDGMLAAAAIFSPTPDWRTKLQWLEANGALCREMPHESEYWVKLVELPEPDCIERLQLLQQRALLQQGAIAYISSASVRAAKVQVVRYLREQGLLDDAAVRGALTAAAGAGDVALLAELFELFELRSVEDPLIVVNAAASNCHLPVLQWLLEREAGQDGPMRRLFTDSFLTYAAVKSGSLQLVQWVRERGARWNKLTFLHAVWAGNVALLEWLVAEGCPVGDTAGYYLAAAHIGDLATLHCLLRLGYPMPGSTTFSDAVALGASLAGLRWLVEQGCPVDWRQAERRVQQGVRAGDPGAEAVWAWIKEQLLKNRRGAKGQPSAKG